MFISPTFDIFIVIPNFCSNIIYFTRNKLKSRKQFCTPKNKSIIGRNPIVKKSFKKDLSNNNGNKATLKANAKIINNTIDKMINPKKT